MFNILFSRQIIVFIRHTLTHSVSICQTIFLVQPTGGGIGFPLAHAPIHKFQQAVVPFAHQHAYHPVGERTSPQQCANTKPYNSASSNIPFIYCIFAKYDLS